MQTKGPMISRRTWHRCGELIGAGMPKSKMDPGRSPEEQRLDSGGIVFGERVVFNYNDYRVAVAINYHYQIIPAALGSRGLL